MLNNHQKAQLKGLASTLNIKYQVGKNEISDSLIVMLDKALTAHELIKIDVMKGYTESINELAINLSVRLNAEIVEVIGRVIVLYRRNKDKPKIKLVK